MCYRLFAILRVKLLSFLFFTASSTSAPSFLRPTGRVDGIYAFLGFQLRRSSSTARILNIFAFPISEGRGIAYISRFVHSNLTMALPVRASRGLSSTFLRRRTTGSGSGCTDAGKMVGESTLGRESSGRGVGTRETRRWMSVRPAVNPGSSQSAISSSSRAFPFFLYSSSRINIHCVWNQPHHRGIRR